MKFISKIFDSISSLFKATISFFTSHIRLTVILAILLVALLLIMVFHNGFEIVNSDFGCSWNWSSCSVERNSPSGCAIFGSNLKGISVNNSCVEFEWYPLFFGISYNHYKSYDNCASPVVFGIDLFALNCAGTKRNYYYPESTYLPAVLHTTQAVEGKDYVISDLKYTIKDNQGNSFSSSNPDELFTSWVYDEILKAALINVGYLNFYITVSYDIEVSQEMKMTCIAWAHPNLTSEKSARQTYELTPSEKTKVTLNISLQGADAMYSASMDIGFRNEAKVQSYTLGEQ